MLTAALAGALVVVALVASTPRLRNVHHRSAPEHRLPAGARGPADHAALLDALSRRVRTGSSLSAALVEEGRNHRDLAAAAASVEQGDALAGALRSVRAVDADLALTVQALSAAAHLGGPVAATLDAAAAVLRERAAARAERSAHSAQARLSARVLTVVPMAFTAWSATSNASTRHLFLTNAAAGTCGVVGILLNIAGWQWMRKIVGPP